MEIEVISPDGKFEWNDEKNKANLKKHGISFEEILPMFDDPLFYTKYIQHLMKHAILEWQNYMGLLLLSLFIQKGLGQE